MSHRQPCWTTTAAQQQYVAQQHFVTMHAQQYATQHLQVATQHQQVATQRQQVATKQQRVATWQQKVTKKQQKAGTQQLEAENQEQDENAGTTKTTQERLQ